MDMLLRLYLTIPMSTSTAERTFSTLRRLKTYLRATMTQSRLNHIVLLNSHRERTDKLDLTVVANDLLYVLYVVNQNIFSLCTYIFIQFSAFLYGYTETQNVEIRNKVTIKN